MIWAQMDPTDALSCLHLLSLGKGASLLVQIPLHSVFTIFRDSELSKLLLWPWKLLTLSASTLSVSENQFFLFCSIYLILKELISNGIYQLNRNETKIQIIHFCFNFPEDSFLFQFQLTPSHVPVLEGGESHHPPITVSTVVCIHWFL